MPLARVRGIATAVATLLVPSGCWGDLLGLNIPTGPAAPKMSVSAGGNHACAVSLDGSVYCWGGNSNGELGIGSVDLAPHPNPIKVLNLPSMKAVSAGERHTCGLSTSGTAYCWGYGGQGALGTGDTLSRQSPALVSGTISFTSISAGEGSHTCGVATGSVAYCWGNGVYGQLGDGGSTSKSVPTAVSGGLQFLTISAGESHTCATAAGRAYCWGYNAHGSLGSGTPTGSQPVATIVSDVMVFSSVQAGFRYSCGTSVPPRCWGLNLDGQLGAATPDSCLGFSDDLFPCSQTPIPVQGAPPSMTSIAVNRSHSCGVTSAGQAYCWGANTHGELGDGTTGQILPIGKVGGTFAFAGVTVGTGHTCGVTTSNEIYCWGNNSAGQVGDGSTNEQHLPVRVTLPP